VWPGTTVPRFGVILAAQTASGLIVPASAVAGPAPIDAISTCLTSTKVLGRPLTDAELDKWLKAATDEHFIMEAAIWPARWSTMAPWTSTSSWMPPATCSASRCAPRSRT